jgi:hypothetical protein
MRRDLVGMKLGISHTGEVQFLFIKSFFDQHLSSIILLEVF